MGKKVVVLHKVDEEVWKELKIMAIREGLNIPEMVQKPSSSTKIDLHVIEVT